MSSPSVLRAMRRREVGTGTTRQIESAARRVRPSTLVALVELSAATGMAPTRGIIGTVVLGFGEGLAEMLVSCGPIPIGLQDEQYTPTNSPPFLFLHFWRVQRAGAAPCTLLRQQRIFPLPNFDLSDWGLITGDGWLGPPQIEYREYTECGLALVTCKPRWCRHTDEPFEAYLALIPIPGYHGWNAKDDLVLSATIPWEKGTNSPIMSLVPAEASCDVDLRVIAQNDTSIYVFDVSFPRKTVDASKRNAEPYWHRISQTSSHSPWDFQLLTGLSPSDRQIFASQFEVQAIIKKASQIITEGYVPQSYNFKVIEIRDAAVYILFWASYQSGGNTPIRYAQTVGVNILDLVSGKIRVVHGSTLQQEFLHRRTPMPGPIVAAICRETMTKARRLLRKLAGPPRYFRSWNLSNEENLRIESLQSGPLRARLNDPL